MKELLLIVWALAAAVSACGIYMLFRNNWVWARRVELINWHFASPGWAMGKFDELYGSYEAWLYHRPFCWDANKLAGVKFRD